MTPLLDVQNVSKAFGTHVLFKDISFSVGEGQRVGLIATNGTGKTTLLNILAGVLSPDKGKVTWTNGVTFSYLDQQLKIDKDMPLSDYLYGVYKDLYDKEKTMEALYEKASTDPDNFEKILAKAERIQNELDQNNFYALEEKVGRLTDGLGLDKAHMEMPLHELSSGQREKAYLAKIGRAHV